MGKYSAPFVKDNFDLVRVISMIYQRMGELGYFDEVKDAIEEAMGPLE